MSQPETIALHTPSMAFSCFCSAQQNRSKGVFLSPPLSLSISLTLTRRNICRGKKIYLFFKPPEREFLLRLCDNRKIEAKAKQIRRATKKIKEKKKKKKLEFRYLHNYT